MPIPNIEIQNDSGRSDIVDLPTVPPEGIAEIDTSAKTELSQPAGETLKDFSDWLKTLPPSGRTVEEIEEQIREERDAWGE